MTQALELVEHDDEMMRQRAKRQELSVERLGILLHLEAWALHGPLDDLDVKADLLLERGDLALSGTPQVLDRVTDHRVVDATDEPRDAHDPLKVDLDDVKRRRVVALGLGELQCELVRERRLARVAGAKQRDVGLPLQDQGDAVGEGLHPDDLGRVVEGSIPDEGVERHCCIVPPRRYKSVPDIRYIGGTGSPCERHAFRT